MRQTIECAAGTLQDAFRPGPDISGRNRLRRELDDVITACQREMQLGDTPPDLLHPSQVSGLLITFSCPFTPQETLFLPQPPQQDARHPPPLTLLSPHP